MEISQELKKRLEAALGQEFAADAVERITWWNAVGLYSFNDGYTTWQNWFRVLPKRCDPTTILDASGWGFTGSDGQRAFRLSDFACLDKGLSLVPPINVVATAYSPAPSFLTITHSFVDNGADAEITVSAWDPNGAAAPDITFDWRCRVALSPSIIQREPRATPSS
jgi:hypothetical protein